MSLRTILLRGERTMKDKVNYLPVLMISLFFVFLSGSAWSQTQTLEADVVIIGAGTSGLPAAVTAAEGGAKVIVFEKTNTTGGTGNRGMGLFAVESRLQREKQMPLSRDEAFEIFMTYTHWRVNARLVRAYIDKSADTIDWLEKMGVEFVEPASYFPQSRPTWHIVKDPDQGKSGLNVMSAALKILANRAREKGVQILFETPAKRIIKERNRIVGVIGEDKSGNSVRVNAKAVIIATGGFSDNPEMIKEYTPYEWGVDVFSTRMPGLTGDGIRMAWEVGAAKHLEAMNIELTFGGASKGGGGGIPMGIGGVIRQPRAIMVNLDGKRFYNEGIMGNTTFTGNAIAQQKRRTGFLVIDSTIAKHYEEKGADTVTRVGRPMWKFSNIEKGMTEAVKRGASGLFVADSLEDLARQTDIDLAGLKETIDEYNRFCEKGFDDLFNKSHGYLTPLKGPKFYASQVFPTGYGTLGGIKINERTEVLDTEEKPIPGLYAVGVDANSIYADSYVFVLPGNTMGFAVNTGRIAGENALKYIGE
jgi:fumarate reductase flavoprotein subunit